MRLSLCAAVVLAVMTTMVTLPAQSPEAERYWPQWRGPSANGLSRTANPPTEWSETKNVRWKAEIPGRGHSTPVVWGDHLFLTTAIPMGVDGEAQHAPRGTLASRGVHRFVVMAIDRKTGKTAWQQVANEVEPHEAAHVDNGSWASGSPIVDGQRLFAYFESFGLYAYTLDGTLLWKRDLGRKRMRNQFGEGSTPVLHGNTLVIVWDHLNGESFVVALDARDGKELWRQPRKEIDTWATPLVREVNGRAQVIVPAMNRIRGYDLETGSVVWEGDGLTMNPIPSPVYDDEMVYLMSGFQGNDLRAIRLDKAKGVIDGTEAVAWSFDRDAPYVPSPILVDGVLYFLKTNSGVLSAFEAKTGKPIFQNQRLDGVPNVFASPAAAGGRIYIPGKDGGTTVLKAGRSFQTLATNTLDDGFDASPVLVDRDLYLRGHKYLYAISDAPR
ncbi:MAG: PQQ-binding-like beta-propeller repeat protein [Vicinamibacterales bacterium]|nr:PQQ-binding-like beta-propeller repeat protein [Vicinamibacterales bacterium]